MQAYADVLPFNRAALSGVFLGQPSLDRETGDVTNGKNYRSFDAITSVTRFMRESDGTNSD